MSNPKLKLLLTGNPIVELNGVPITGFRSAKAEALFYYLAVTARPHLRPSLAGIFWGEVEETYARRSLTKALSNLRQLFGDYLIIDRQQAAFNAESSYWVDAVHFESGQSALQANIVGLREAVEQVQGDFLEGFYIEDAPEFEQWVLVERARLRENVIQAFQTLAEYDADQGDLSQACDYMRRVLTLEPWREETHCQLMIWLAKNGQRGAALAQFEVCKAAPRKWQMACTFTLEVLLFALDL